MTNRDIRSIALRQSAVDLGCRAEDFDKDTNTVVLSRPHPDARRYLSLPFLCNIVTYGHGAVASVSPAYEAVVRDYIDRYPVYHLFETPHMQVLNDAVRPLGGKVCFMAEYFLPDPDLLRPLPCPYEMRVLTQPDFTDLYVPAWSNALCESRRELDVLGVGAYDGDTPVGFAACSADCTDMWQIGIDVLPAYRRRGIASAVTARLALEILARDKVPFYCAAWSNIASVRNAVRVGFRPAWVEMTVKSAETVDEMNGVG